MTAYPFRDLPAGVAELKDLALDLRWTWSHHADALWNRVDGESWTIATRQRRDGIIDASNAKSGADG